MWSSQQLKQAGITCVLIDAIAAAAAAGALH
jgi:hypothetical protein